MKILLGVLLLSISVSAQTITTGPVSTLNKVAWGTPDGLTASDAQALEAHLKIDGVSLVITGAVCTANTLTDGSGGTWSYGPGDPPSIQIFRNGAQIVNAFGIKMGVINGVLYLQGDDKLYYKWLGTTFVRTVTTDPTNSTIDAAAIAKWGCQAPVSLALMRLLNVRASHDMTLSLVNTTSKLESPDSSSFRITTPQFVTQPITVRIIQ